MASKITETSAISSDSGETGQRKLAVSATTGEQSGAGNEATASLTDTATTSTRPLVPLTTQDVLDVNKMDASMGTEGRRGGSRRGAGALGIRAPTASTWPFPFSVLANYLPPDLRVYLSPAFIGLHTTYTQTLLLLGSTSSAYFMGTLFGFLNPAGWAALAGFLVWLIGVWKHNVDRNWTAAKATVRRELAAEKLETESESVEWINLWLQRHWMKIEPWISEQVTAVANALLDENRPLFLESLELSEFTLGSYAPRIESVRSHPTLGDDLVQYELRLSFIPARTILLSTDSPSSRIVLTAWVGRAGIRIPVPVLVSDISFEAVLIVRARLESGAPPNIRTVQIQVPEDAGVKAGFVLRPLKSVDLLDLPGLRSFIESLIDTNVRSQLAPPGLTIDVGKLLAPEPHVNKELAVGLLRVRILRARHLKSPEWLGVGDPYVRILLGPAGSTRELARTRWIPQNSNPNWLELHHVLIPASAFSSPIDDLSDLIHFEVRDHNDFQGDALIGVTAPLPLSKWAALLPKSDSDDSSPVQVSSKSGGKEDGEIGGRPDSSSEVGPDPTLSPEEEEQMKQAWGTPLGGVNVWKLLHYPGKSGKSTYGTLELQLSYFPVRDTTGERVEPAATKGSALEASVVSAVPQSDKKVDPKEELLEGASTFGVNEGSSSNKQVTAEQAPAVADFAEPVNDESASAQEPSNPLPEPSLKDSILGGKPPIRTGILRVTVHQARNLDTNGPDEAHKNRSAARFLFEAAQKVIGGVTGLFLSGPFTPYVTVRTEDGKLAWKSVRRRRTVNPLFEQTFELFVEDIRRAKLHFVVKDATDFSSDPVVGECSVRVAEALQRIPTDDWYTLYNCDTGELRLSFVFIPMDLRRMMRQVRKVRRNIRLGVPATTGTGADSESETASNTSESAILANTQDVQAPTASEDVPGAPTEALTESSNPFVRVSLEAARSLPYSIDAYVSAYLSPSTHLEPDLEPLFRTKAAIREPDPRYDDQFEVEIDEWTPKDARLLFVIRDRRSGTTDEDPVVGTASLKLSSLKPNVKRDMFLPLISEEGEFQLDRDAGLKVAALLRPDASEGDYVVERGSGGRSLGQQNIFPSRYMVEKDLAKADEGQHSLEASMKSIGHKVRRIAKAPGRLLPSSRKVDDPNPNPNPDYLDPRAVSGSLLTRRVPGSVERAKHAMEKSGIGAELMYWVHYLSRGIVQPRHMRAGILAVELLSVGALDPRLDVEQDIRVVRLKHTFTSSGVPINVLLRPGTAFELPIDTSEPAKFSVEVRGRVKSILESIKTASVILDLRETIRRRGTHWDKPDDEKSTAWNSVVEIPILLEHGPNTETLRAEVFLKVGFKILVGERDTRKKIEEARDRARQPLLHLASRHEPSDAAISTAARSSPSRSVSLSDAPLVSLATSQPTVGPPDMALQTSIVRAQARMEQQTDM